jgi:hypothetical protein
MVKSTRAFLFPLPLGFMRFANHFQHAVGFWSVSGADLPPYNEHLQIGLTLPFVFLDMINRDCPYDFAQSSDYIKIFPFPPDAEKRDEVVVNAARKR